MKFFVFFCIVLMVVVGCPPPKNNAWVVILGLILSFVVGMCR